MNGIIFGAMMALGMVQQTDTTFALDGAEYLDVESLGGSIVVDVWDEDRVRIRAQHSTRTYIEIRRRRRGISVESEARRGPANLVDFEITVPRRLALQLEAQYGDITIHGSDGRIEAQTLQGDVTIRGGRGSIKVSSTMGSILVDGADGTIEIESSAADIHIQNSSGEIYAETAGGTIVLENVDPSAVDVGSTGGRVYYDGTFRRGGTYFFGAHGGSITIVVPIDASASFNVATVHGSITSTLEGQPQSFRGGERHEFTVGEGGALVEAETYGGRIRLVRPGTEGSEAPTRRVREVRDADNALMGATEYGFGPALGVAARVIPHAMADLMPHLRDEIDHAVQMSFQTEFEFDFEFDLGHELRIDIPHENGSEIRRENAPATIRQ